MLVHEMIVAERHHMADLFAGLTGEQLARQSLCDAWTMHEVAAHLATYLRFGQLKILACMVGYAGNFAPGNQKLARWYARRSTADLVKLLRRNAESRATPPRSGYDPVLTDLVLHDLDVRVPLGIPRDIPEDRLRGWGRAAAPADQSGDRDPGTRSAQEDGRNRAAAIGSPVP